MAKTQMQPEIMEGLAHRVWEEKCNINKLCSRQTKGGFISYCHIGTIITSQVVQAIPQPLSCADPTCKYSVTREMTLLPVK